MSFMICVASQQKQTQPNKKKKDWIDEAVSDWHGEYNQGFKTCVHLSLSTASFKRFIYTTHVINCLIDFSLYLNI